MTESKPIQCWHTPSGFTESHGNRSFPGMRSWSRCLGLETMSRRNNVSSLLSQTKCSTSHLATVCIGSRLGPKGLSISDHLFLSRHFVQVLAMHSSPMHCVTDLQSASEFLATNWLCVVFCQH